VLEHLDAELPYRRAEPELIFEPSREHAEEAAQAKAARAVITPSRFISLSP
jgi:hypothetical protein